ncbi:MAG: hypothetical protein A2017_16675 [Lentisphaerae bacterium GWF2_44_16]|nr:MAG: hypothetical protein A2017_16675 [Lentisphaerae bacterium GWF2_44_16]
MSDEFKVDIASIPLNRAPGISAFMRVRNEGEFLEQAIETHLPYFDEFVIVYNRCTDNSEEIIREFAAKSDKIKAYHYLPHVYPQGSSKHYELPQDSVHSFVNYSNYALSKTTKTICTKIDADHIAVAPRIKFLIDGLRKGFLGEKDFLLFSGINLWREENKMLVKKDMSFSGITGDIGFFHVGPDIYFIRVEQGETLKIKYDKSYRVINGGLMYFHMKGAKKDRGITNYDLDENPQSYYVPVVESEWQNQEALSFNEFVSLHPEFPELKEFCDPNDLIILDN